jgi:hypothetical protein
LPEAQLVERALSMSAMSEDRLGSRVKQLIDEINELAARSSHEGTLREVVESSALVAHRRTNEKYLRHLAAVIGHALV